MPSSRFSFSPLFRFRGEKLASQRHRNMLCALGCHYGGRFYEIPGARGGDRPVNERPVLDIQSEPRCVCRIHLASTNNCFNDWRAMPICNGESRRLSVILTPRHRAAVELSLPRWIPPVPPGCGKCQFIDYRHFYHSAA